MTDLRSHRRVDELNSDALALGLVRDELLKLSERPAGHHTVEVAIPRLGTGADTFEVLHTDSPASGRLQNDGFAQVVVLPRYPSPLFPRQPFQDAPCARSAFGLKRRTYSPEFLLDLLKFLSGEILSRRERGDVADAEIDTESGAGLRGLIGVFDNDVDEPPIALLNNRCGGRSLACETIALELSEDQWDMDTTVDHRERHGLILGAIVKHAGVIVDACRGELRGLVSFVLGRCQSLRDSANSSDDKIGGKAKFFFDILVDQMVNLDVVVRAVLNRHGKNPVAGVRKYLASLAQRFRHYGCRDHLAFNRSLAHGENYSTFAWFCKVEFGGRHSSAA